ncbi:S8 family serine peptidase [Micromonospora sp. WMMD1120]|uniref:S8 family serine peptidase n=1 Tax=Micromonospora sp. WMMD1120 TaxID=3016106 RepID=UPI0024169137|nr:S8 family serine peptidase [Micromonospora sp. WMMD1120]MDG4809477.1 S8 family serine peptidase [Micromonospora sp. WMMD1120]
MTLRSTHRWAVAGLVVALLAVLTPAAPATAAVDEYVLYATVTANSSGQGQTLADIAGRYLGDAERADELFNLNSGRRQPDGKALTDADRLTPGWYVVLPWDAVGPGVQYGVLPTRPPDPSATASPPSTATGPGTPPSSPDPLPTSRPGGKCVAATVASDRSTWATTRLAADRVWPRTRGAGQLVAVVDSGVDGRLPQLTGRVAQGADLVTGGRRGDTDCLGTGTAMAGLIAASAPPGGGFAGIAPDAVVLPIRIATDGKPVGPADQAAAIEVAASAGATVIALGDHVTVTDEAVRRAIEQALSRDIVVIAGAPAGAANAGAADLLPEYLLLVGGVSADGKAAEEYATDTVDVVAPGVNVSSLGITGTTGFVGSGTRYAVALAAGEAALVRAAHPRLSAVQVARRIVLTADEMGGAQAGSPYGHGMIDPEAAVIEDLPDETESVPPESAGTSGGVAGAGTVAQIAILLTMVAALVAGALLVIRLRRSTRRPSDGTGEPPVAAEPTGAPEPQTSTPSGGR